MKKLSYFLMIILGLFLVSCSETSKYDNGYEAAWEGEEEPSWFASKKAKEGYDNGLEDAWTYDTGYEDGYKGKRPQFFNDPLYMEAYRNGKKEKEGGI
ncbi:MAG: hypothetical protein K1000chlam2_01281 [Chlamydiae bacterium]|nr:hypothetical protein [Chlamydiota bacterium]